MWKRDGSLRGVVFGALAIAMVVPAAAGAAAPDPRDQRQQVVTIRAAATLEGHDDTCVISGQFDDRFRAGDPAEDITPVTPAPNVSPFSDGSGPLRFACDGAAVCFADPDDGISVDAFASGLVRVTVPYRLFGTSGDRSPFPSNGRCLKGQGLDGVAEFAVWPGGIQCLSDLPQHVDEHTDRTIELDELCVLNDDSMIAPKATATATRAAGSLTVDFDASFSYDPDGYIETYFWEFGDGTQVVTTSPTVSHTYASAGTYAPKVTVTDHTLLTDRAAVLGPDLEPTIQVSGMTIGELIDQRSDIEESETPVGVTDVDGLEWKPQREWGGLLPD